MVFLVNVNFNRESKRAKFYTPFPSGGGGARMKKMTDTQGKLEKLGFLNGIFWCININVVFETTP